MVISYNWLCEYLPADDGNGKTRPTPEHLSKILTSVGLEVESLKKYESIKGGLKGLIVGEVISAEKHPNADKLKLTSVNIGQPEPLRIVCGANNVQKGQKVIIAVPGTTIFPMKGDPFTIKSTKIRGEESNGMICAEDEIGLGENHDGILVLPSEAVVGKPAENYFKSYEDYIYEIGLTPNHMDAMSHLGVARDVCAYLSHHDKKDYRVKMPHVSLFGPDSHNIPIRVSIINKKDCERYSGVSIKGITIKESPIWLQNKLKSIGLRPINNIVDITNFVLHEMGQPLHAFDADAIKGRRILVKNLPEGTRFVTLDEKERTLSEEDLMICNEEEGMCIAGVFGGLESGVKSTTKNIFLESAWFNPVAIRKTSLRHGLRTDAASHFEKGMDISNTVAALKRAALLIKELAGGEIASDIVDEYPLPRPKTQIILKYHYLKKLSGKNYHSDTVRKILMSLGFDVLRESMDDILVAVPFHKPDILLPADVVEEIMRIDGYDNIEIPTTITISPSIGTDRLLSSYRDKIASYLVGTGFHEIFTNSITNSAYFSEEELKGSVKMINNLSAELNIMRPSLLQTGLETLAYNINRKNNNLKFFEFGKSYGSSGVGKYSEKNHLSLYVTGNLINDTWKAKSIPSDLFYLKGIVKRVLQLLNIDANVVAGEENKKLEMHLIARKKDILLVEAGKVDAGLLHSFDIRQSVFFADFNWDELIRMASINKIEFKELPKQLPVYRDLAMIVDSSLPFDSLEKTIRDARVSKLQEVQLFDIFESEKLGKGKKSLAISLTFMDEEKTLTDKEIDTMMQTIMKKLEDDIKAEIRK